uniref:Uncharacterized protein n=1 Tax=Oryza punctata TaxID=4537 RepID=A0A0E0L0U4_ORYPU
MAATISPAPRWRKGADEIQPSAAAPVAPAPAGLLNHPAPAPASLLHHHAATSPAPASLLYRRAALEEDRRGRAPGPGEGHRRVLRRRSPLHQREEGQGRGRARERDGWMAM